MKKKKKLRKLLISIFILALVPAAYLLWRQTDFFEEPARVVTETVNTARQSIQEVMRSEDEAGIQETFYYSQLSEEGRRVYRRLLKGFEKSDTNIFLSSGDSDIITEAINAVLADHPEIFWMDGNGEIVSYELFSYYTPYYNCSKEERDRRQQEIDRVTAECLNGIDENVSEYEKLKYLYDYIVYTTYYELDAPDSQNMYSALVNKTSVCAGYSKALQYLLGQLGMECIYVMGNVNQNQPHAWNIVKCEGEYYQVDVTWGDPVFQKNEGIDIPPELTIDYDYLCCTDVEILQSHEPDGRYAYPPCTAVSCNYYRRNGLYYEQYDEQAFWQAMMKSIQAGEAQTVFKFANAELYNQAEQVILEQQAAQAASELAELYGLYQVRYSYIKSPQMCKIILLWNYQEL